VREVPVVVAHHSDARVDHHETYQFQINKEVIETQEPPLPRSEPSLSSSSRVTAVPADHGATIGERESSRGQLLLEEPRGALLTCAEIGALLADREEAASTKGRPSAAAAARDGCGACADAVAGGVTCAGGGARGGSDSGATTALAPAPSPMRRLPEAPVGFGFEDDDGAKTLAPTPASHRPPPLPTSMQRGIPIIIITPWLGSAAPSLAPTTAPRPGSGDDVDGGNHRDGREGPSPLPIGNHDDGNDDDSNADDGNGDDDDSLVIAVDRGMVRRHLLRRPPPRGKISSGVMRPSDDVCWRLLTSSLLHR